MESVPTKQTIQESFRGASTRRTYLTYQMQFQEFCVSHKHGLVPAAATTEDCTDFFHHLYSLGRKPRTVNFAKTSLVAYFKDQHVEPNLAQAPLSKQYVVGLQKYNRQNNVDDVEKAHPLTIDELSTLINGFARLNPFVGAIFRCLFSCCYLGCFRISEMLGLIWGDVSFGKSAHGPYVSVRLRWHKKASVEKECQTSKDAFVFPHVTMLPSGNVDWFKAMEQTFVRRQLNDIVESSPGLPVGISLHSMRRGGCFYRVFESPERRFDFRELMAWCRWGDAKTCCEYLVTRTLSNAIDPRLLLEKRSLVPSGVHGGNLGGHVTADNIAAAVMKCLRVESVLSPHVGLPVAKRQQTMQEYACALKDYSKEMVKSDRRKYSEWQTLATAFNKFVLGFASRS
ncbi:hypothetical protein H257_04786 [Aphanomyces astaci]|uniref:Core-binding (CB) domain-containing protein n=1 Tax=Aphanomyces astaci TaxID=112090 RepID=W4GVW0_APHAT|nr:hypothetical protein H257_04786 [Aphanomyces astaci]ETV83043.1 hypothetical protein H257_04786 [Aphanomyces astaci]|eukprot:XP_009827714.1 hypothetical protein H257_04786 [Aphanomyces astaci]